LVAVDLSHGAGRLPRWLVASGPQVEVDPAALELKFVDLALTVVFAAGLERQDFQVAGQVLELGQQFSYGHPTQRSVLSALCGLELGGSWLDRSEREPRTEPRRVRLRGGVRPLASNRAHRAPPT
jgi:hypothetical protein